MPVGEGETSGDAIALRYGVPERFFVHVVDGGTETSGQLLVDHVRHVYYSDIVHNLVCTHPDDDHTSGLRTVIDNVRVGAIWMHRPWLYANELIGSFRGRWTAGGLHRALRECFPILHEIETMAVLRGVAIFEPFMGAQIGPFFVTSPTRQRYLELLPQFSRTPDPVRQDLEIDVLDLLRGFGQKISSFVTDFWHDEYLPGGETSPSNESSVIQVAGFPGGKVLLTGDAGVHALSKTADLLERTDFELPGIGFIQIPHHGSRRNVASHVLNRLVGAPLVFRGSIRGTAFVSASQKAPDHPRPRVVNAFTRRGYNVFSTQGKKIQHSHSFSDRGWLRADPLPFSEIYEEAA